MFPAPSRALPFPLYLLAGAYLENRGNTRAHSCALKRFRRCFSVHANAIVATNRSQLDSADSISVRCC